MSGSSKRYLLYFAALSTPLMALFMRRSSKRRESAVRKVARHEDLQAMADACRQGESRFRALVAATSDVVYSMSPDWSEMLRLHSRSFLAPTEVPSNAWLQTYIPDEDRALVTATINHAVKNGTKFELEHRVIRPDGTVGWTLSRAIPMRGADGQIVEWLGVASDITDRKRTELALQQTQERFRSFMDNSPTIAWVKDEQGKYVYVSRTFGARYGPGGEDLLGKTDAELWPEDTARRFRENDLAVLASGRPMEMVEEAGNPDGSTSVWLNTKFPIHDSSGATFVAGIGLDITDRKRAEELILRTEKLAATGRLAATIAHEINNPLAAAMNAIYLANTNPAQASEMLRIAEQELGRAAHITQLTLGFYRENSKQQISLPRLIEELLVVYAAKLRNRNITVQCRYRCAIAAPRGGCPQGCQGCEGCFQVNAGELRQIISNIVANGIDALLDGGGMRMHVARSSEGIKLTIADNGHGIRTENLKRVFEPFFTTKEFGTGLGLWVTQELVHKHGGVIKVRSRKNRGTVFRMSFPIQAASDSNNRAPIPTSFAKSA